MPSDYKVLLSKRVARDLESIFEFVVRDSATNALKLIERIHSSIGKLRQFPHRTIVANPNTDRPIRSIGVHSYIIFFRVDESARVVRILRVRHGARRSLRRFE
jgi:plasmid stabilization system protein ParE